MSILNEEQAEQITALITESLLEKLGSDVSEILSALVELEARVVQLELEVELLKNDRSALWRPPS